MNCRRTLERAILALALVVTIVAPSRATISADRTQTLSRGVNLISVFSDKPIALVLSDLHAIKQDNFENVRILVDAVWAQHLSSAPTRLDRVVQAAIQEHLGVILCMISADHPLDKTANAATLELWTRAWSKLASRYTKFDPSKVFFEIANEPSMESSRWVAAQNDLLRLVRAEAPKNTILLTASPVSMVWSLHSLPQIDDSDVAYVVHLYQPMDFTHQSASWAGAPYMFIHHLDYPPNQPNVREVEQHAVKEAIPSLRQYLATGGQALNTELDVAERWAKARNASVVVTEFGVYRAAPKTARIRWLAEARKGMESRGFGWDVWEYDGGFGVKQDLERPGCQGVRQALGLCE